MDGGVGAFEFDVAGEDVYFEESIGEAGFYAGRSSIDVASSVLILAS